MPKRQDPIEETLAGELYNYFLEFIKEKGGIPLERSFWGWLISQDKYSNEQLPEHIFRWAFGRLIKEHWLEVEPLTRSLTVVNRADVEILVRGKSRNR